MLSEDCKECAIKDCMIKVKNESLKSEMTHANRKEWIKKRFKCSYGRKECKMTCEKFECVREKFFNCRSHAKCE